MPRNGSDVYSKAAGTTAVPNTTVRSAQFNDTINDIVQDLNNPRPIVVGGTGAASKSTAATALEVVSYGTAQTLTAAQQAIARTSISAALNGHLYGLTLSNNVTDATNDIDIAAGEAASTEAIPVLMVLASAITKRLDAAWAVGTGNGGLDTGSIANTTYHVWLIQRSDTGVVDVLFSTSATSPTMPTNYDRKRRIGSIVRISAAIKAFTQNGDEFLWKVGVQDLGTTTLATTSVLFPLTVPTGISVNAITASLGFAAVDWDILITSPDQTASAASSVLFSARDVGGQRTMINLTIRTDTSGQIRAVSDVANTFLVTITQGYIDTRGRT